MTQCRHLAPLIRYVTTSVHKLDKINYNNKISIKIGKDTLEGIIDKHVSLNILLPIPPHVKILKNICSRIIYTNSNFSERDIDIILDILRAHVEEKKSRFPQKYDDLYEEIINFYGLDVYVTELKYFNYQTY